MGVGLMAKAFVNRLSFLAAIILLICGTAMGGSIWFSVYPQLSSSTLIADDSTVYTVTMTVGDTSGYNDIKSVRVLFNWSIANGDQSKGRGYFTWGVNDSEITTFGGTWVISNATGGGRWGYRSDAWGGDIYVTPVSCSTSVQGSSSGATGYRTVTFSFKVKPAWANNPLINVVNCWANDPSIRTGWLDPGVEFDVIPAPCSSYLPTPPTPIVSDVSANSMKVSIAESAPDSNLYCMKFFSVEGKHYYQGNGIFGVWPVFLPKSSLQNVTISGLRPSTTYTVSFKAMSETPGVCPSAWSEVVQATTSMAEVEVEPLAAGKKIRPEILGAATMNTWMSWWNGYLRIEEVATNTSIRGVAGGLDADTYNWKDLSGQNVGHGGQIPPPWTCFTTLEFMRRARNINSEVYITANVRGIGSYSSPLSSFYYTDTSVEIVKKLAEDWVRYVNLILPNKRQGDPLTTEEQELLDSINWYGRPKLLEPGEPATSKVTYWEIGNEPELGMPYANPNAPVMAPSPEEYSYRYQVMANAMKAVDPTIKIGPCITTAHNGNAHLDAVLQNPQAPVDFIAYHPYGTLYWAALTTGDTPASAEKSCRETFERQVMFYNTIVDRIIASGRDPSTIELAATEYNQSDWRWSGTTYAARMSHALAGAETIFAFAHLGVVAGHYWLYTTYSDGTLTPGHSMMLEQKERMGNRIASVYSDNYSLRVYTCRDTNTGNIYVWILNFSNDTDTPVRIKLNDVCGAQRIIARTLKHVSNPKTYLLDYTPYGSQPVINWFTEELTGQINPADFVYIARQAEAVVLTFENPCVTPLPPVAAFSAIAGDEKNTLTWQNSSSPRTFGVLIKYKTTGFPTGPNDGETLVDKLVQPGSSDNLVHTGLTNGVTYYYAIYSYDTEGRYSNPVMAKATARNTPLAEFKLLPDNTNINVKSKIVTAVFSTQSCFYVRDPDLSSGIRVALNPSGIAVGDEISFSGRMGTRFVSSVASERQITNVTNLTKLSSGNPVEPLNMSCKAVGGAKIQSGTVVVPGVIDAAGKLGIGLNNIGQLVRIQGKVTEKLSSYIWVDDGSKILDISDRVGIMVSCPGTSIPVSKGDWVAVTGIVEGSVPTGWTTNRRAIRIRTWQDLTVIPQP